jgi:hypothetical protein
MELEFLPAVASFFAARSAGDEVSADLLVLCQEIAGTTPPTSYPGCARLREHLRDIFYLRYYKRNQSVRLYFLADRGILLVIAINTNKRRTSLTEGEKKQLQNALRDGNARIADMVRERSGQRPHQPHSPPSKSRSKRSKR